MASGSSTSCSLIPNNLTRRVQLNNTQVNIVEMAGQATETSGPLGLPAANRCPMSDNEITHASRSGDAPLGYDILVLAAAGHTVTDKQSDLDLRAAIRGEMTFTEAVERRSPVLSGGEQPEGCYRGRCLFRQQMRACLQRSNSAPARASRDAEASYA